MREREDGDIKREKMELFWAGVCALREGRSPETGGSPALRETASQVGPRRSCRVLGNWAKQGLRGQKKEKTALLSLLTVHELWPQPDGGLGEPGMGAHINLDSTHGPCSTEGRPR